MRVAGGDRSDRSVVADKLQSTVPFSDSFSRFLFDRVEV